ncbi:S8 family serine peptidase [Nonlabens xiamenensis]|uniref:S8 family serine peptidase n=1 Tax=Nonlabens xiamenensis TaxID=2341043 RepID=UPI000F6137B5|nr:S8 family serine peptidase [Nonlabens xiamenensis]
MKQFLPGIVFLFCTALGLAQTREQRARYTKDYNKTKLKSMMVKSENAHADLMKQAKAKNVAETITTKDGRTAFLNSFDAKGNPQYIVSYNTSSEIATNTDDVKPGGALGLNLEGENMVMYMWDPNHPWFIHQEFLDSNGDSKITIGDDYTLAFALFKSDDHATHVAGTLVAQGVQPRVEGMSPKASLKAYDAFLDDREAAEAALEGMLLSNHSYGAYHLQGGDPTDLGRYNIRARAFDEITYNAPYYLPVFAAGNDALEGVNSNPVNGLTDKDHLSNLTVSKNGLTVAAAFQSIFGDTPTYLSFSSQGPTDDLRIKPDIAGQGDRVYSSERDNPADYGYSTGTSMAAPNVSGSLLLAQEHHHNLTGSFMPAATLKGLALHTARDIAPAGPDTYTGWGMLDMKKLIETMNNNGNSTLIEELSIHESQTYSITVRASNIEDLMASISWTDQPGSVVDRINDPTPVLVNDLDVRISQNGQEFFPYKLSSLGTHERGDNVVDPFERIDIPNASGEYTITVSRKPRQTNDLQNFTLILTGVDQVVSPGVLSEGIVSFFPYDESFESNNPGLWTQSLQDDIDWTITSGSTPTVGTGPDAAGHGEYYAFVESTVNNGGSYNQPPFNTASLVSPNIIVGSEQYVSVSFLEHKAGEGILGQLTLEMEIAPGAYIDVWHGSPIPVSDQWERHYVDLSPYIPIVNSSFKLRFRRILSSSQTADWAIDDIRIDVGARAIPPSTNYCQNGNAAPDNEFEWIQRVWVQSLDNPDVVNEIDNRTGPSENGYSDFTEVRELDMTFAPNQVTRFYIQGGWPDNQPYPEDYAVYIDYNRDGDFDDSNELVFFAAETSERNLIEDITVPQNIGYGRTRMRVIQYFGVISGPCQTVNYGEVEDYTITLLGDDPFSFYSSGYGADELTLSGSDLKLYPNPVGQELLNLEVLNGEGSHLAIYNTLGQVVIKRDFSQQIEVSELKDGVYILQVTTADGNTLTERFIKK